MVSSTVAPTPPTEAVETSTATADSGPSPSPSPTCRPAPLAARAAAVLVAGLPGVLTAEEPLAVELTQLGVGGVLITESNVADTEQVASLISSLRAASSIPLLVTTDEEPGRASSFEAVLGDSASARTLAANEGVEGVREFAADLAVELRALGVDLNLAPVADLDDGPASGAIGDRSFSGDPATAADAALAYAEGIVSGGLLPAVKHWPGNGRATGGSGLQPATVDATRSELRTTDLVPFETLIEAGVPVVVVSSLRHTAFSPDLPAALAPAAYAELRRSGFTGVAMTDDLAAVSTTVPLGEAAVLALEAGADALLVSEGSAARSMRDAIVSAVESGRIPESRLDEAVARVLGLEGADPASLVCADVDLPTLRPPPPTEEPTDG